MRVEEGEREAAAGTSMGSKRWGSGWVMWKRGQEGDRYVDVGNCGKRQETWTQAVII